MFDDKGNIDLMRIYDDFTLANVTRDNTVISFAQNTPIAADVNTDFLLTKGRWKFTYSNPKVFNFTPSTEKAVYIENSKVVEKEFDIVSVKYDFENNRASIIVDIKENPIFMVIVWGAVIAATALIGAYAVNSVLLSFGSLSDSPLALGTIVVVGLFALAALGFSFKKVNPVVS